MNKQQVVLAGILAAFLLAGAVAGTGGAGKGLAKAFAEDGGENNEVGREGAAAAAGNEGNGEREGAGEREGGGEESEGAAIGGGLSGLILYGVIAAVVGTIGYTAYKIFASRRRSSVQARSS